MLAHTLSEESQHRREDQIKNILSNNPSPPFSLYSPQIPVSQSLTHPDHLNPSPVHLNP